MKTKRISLLILCLFLGFDPIVNGQTFYYSDEQQINISEKKSAIILYYDAIQNNLSYNDTSEIVDSIEYSSDSLGIIFYLNTDWTSTILAFSEYLNINISNLLGSTFAYEYDNGDFVFPTFQVVLTISEGYNLNDIDSIIQLFNLNYIRNVENLILLAANDPAETIEIANALHENTLINWCHPDFLVKAVLDSDPLYSFQYYLNNTGQTGGTTDADIDAPEAWALSTGNNNIVIAVIDQGVENIHDDFYYEQTGLTKVLPGWGWDGNGGYPISGTEKHGNRVAGIIGAEHNTTNNYGIKGVCPQCRILPIRVPLLQFTFSTDYANAFFQARALGADVINCSWNLNAGPFPDITNQINLAIQNGRGGLGCPVIFSSGNNGNSTPGYPSGLPGVITVSALDKNGNLTTYSNYGSHIEIAAFGGVPNDIYTTDLTNLGTVYGGGFGNNYFDLFGGTSAAAAQVSGVAALLLSLDPTLRWDQVVCRIQEGATDIGSFGSDAFYGAGRLNAYYTNATANLDLIDQTIALLQSYAARDNITSGLGTTILTTAFVTLTAGRSIELNPGFDTEIQCVFTAQIQNIGICGSQLGGPFRTAINTAIENVAPSIYKNDFVDIYPNPTKELVRIIINSSSGNSIEEIELFNNYSQQIKKIHTDKVDELVLDMKMFPPGIYYIKIKTTNENYIKRIIKI